MISNVCIQIFKPITVTCCCINVSGPLNALDISCLNSTSAKNKNKSCLACTLYCNTVNIARNLRETVDSRR